eukprot:TRINITY_DN2287_c0_g1_i9.p2 TRINITY_DN2287_c0_g1~~TRINITY_DN2287_c0_g1_i9.p2  ORF type:complete len:102 (+),score=15.98 TRINITY_DN2287_c0_g1_i9:25-306(+)
MASLTWFFVCKMQSALVLSLFLLCLPSDVGALKHAKEDSPEAAIEVPRILAHKIAQQNWAKEMSSKQEKDKTNATKRTEKRGEASEEQRGEER